MKEDKDPDMNIRVSKKVAGGGAAGAVLGAVVAGPVGAVVGGAVGALVGNSVKMKAASAERDQKKGNDRRGASHQSSFNRLSEKRSRSMSSSRNKTRGQASTRSRTPAKKGKKK